MTHATARHAAREAKRWHLAPDDEPVPLYPPVTVGRLYRVAAGVFAGRIVTVEALDPTTRTVTVTVKGADGHGIAATLRLTYAPAELAPVAVRP